MFNKRKMETSHVVACGHLLDAIPVSAIFDRCDNHQMPQLHVKVAHRWLILIINVLLMPGYCWLFITLSVPVVLLNSPNFCPYFSLNKFERILLLIFSSLLCLINSHFQMSYSEMYYVRRSWMLKWEHGAHYSWNSWKFPGILKF